MNTSQTATQGNNNQVKQAQNKPSPKLLFTSQRKDDILTESVKRLINKYNL